MARAAKKYLFVRDDARNAVIEECARAVPSNWCHPLLTGPGVAKPPLDCRAIEELLRGIQDRIRALKSVTAD